MVETVSSAQFAPGAYLQGGAQPTRWLAEMTSHLFGSSPRNALPDVLAGREMQPQAELRPTSPPDFRLPNDEMPEQTAIDIEQIASPIDTPVEATPDPDSLAFNAFYLKNEKALHGYLCRLVPSREVALELAQEAFFRSWQHFGEIQTYDKPEAWLYRVATNLAISHLRRKRAIPFAALVHPRNVVQETESPPEQELLADALDVESQTAQRELITGALATLPERHRAALLLRAVHGFSSEEIGAVLGVTPGNARQMLSRARERFRASYDAAQSADRR